MEYRLRPTEPLVKGVSRAASEQLQHAAVGLRSRETDPAVAVHEARKALKRTRSLLRLSRELFGDDRFSGENTALRNVARTLSRYRDADALLEAFDTLMQRRGAKGIDGTAVRERLHTRRAALAKQGGDAAAAARRKAAVALGAAAARLAVPGDAKKAEKALAKGIERAFDDAREAMRAARAKPTQERMHEWRKQVKHCWYMSQLLSIAWPRFEAAKEDALATLADKLGHDNDLAMLDEFVAREPEPWPASLDVGALRALIAEQRVKVEEQAFSLGKDVLRRAPKRVTKSLKQLWAEPAAAQAAADKARRAGAVAAGKPRLVTAPESRSASL